MCHSAYTASLSGSRETEREVSTYGFALKSIKSCHDIFVRIFHLQKEFSTVEALGLMMEYWKVNFHVTYCVTRRGILTPTSSWVTQLLASRIGPGKHVISIVGIDIRIIDPT